MKENQIQTTFNIVLVSPQIPPNTGNVARLCAASKAALHLVRPLGFRVDHPQMKRAGLDYWEHLPLRLHRDWQEFLQVSENGRRFAFSKRGERIYTDAQYQPSDWLIFGSETMGLSQEMIEECGGAYRIPLLRPAVRSLNLADSVAVVLYEALRQNQFFQ